MSEFEPARPSMVHGRLNEKTFAWNPEWAENYRRMRTIMRRESSNGTDCCSMGGVGLIHLNSWNGQRTSGD